MENYKGRYIKVLNKCLGGLDTLYEVGDYLKVLDDTGKGNCIVVELAGVLSVRGDNSRIAIEDIEIMPVGFIPRFKLLPEKWCVKITQDNFNKARLLNKKELGFPFNYSYSIGGYYTPFKNSAGFFGISYVPSDITEITWEQFETYVLKKSNKSETFPILHKFPESGCCKNTSKEFIKFLDNYFKQTSGYTITPNHKVIGWNSYGYWGLVNKDNSGKPRYDISQLEPFYTKENSYVEYVQKLYKEVEEKQKKEKQLINKKADYGHNEERRESISATKICRPNFKIRQTSPVRGISLRSSKSKIRLGSDNC